MNVNCLIKENGFTLKKKTRSRQHPSDTMIGTDCTDDLALITGTPAQAKSQLHSLKQATGGNGFYMSSNKTELMCFISTQSGKLLKLVDLFTYLSSNISSTESNVNRHIGKKWTAIDWLLIIWKSDLSDEMKWDFFQTMAVTVLLCGWPAWTVMKHKEKAWWELHKNVLSCFWQILEAAPHKTAAVLPFTSHLTSYPSKTNKKC